MNLEGEGSAGDAGNPDALPADAGAEQGNGAAPDAWSGLEQGNRDIVEKKGWKTPNDGINSYRELERHATDLKAKSLVPPGDDAKPEDWTSFYAKLGRPEKPEGYEFKLPEGLPEDFPYDGKSADEFKSWAHGAGLSPKQAQAVHDQYVKHTAAQLAEAQTQNVKAVEAAHNALVKEWGDPATETYKRSQELANRAIRENGGNDLLIELKGIGALDQAGNVRTPRLAILLAKVGAGLAEAPVIGGGGAAGADRDHASALFPNDIRKG